MAKEHGLGKGLGAIFGTSTTVKSDRPKTEHRYKTVAEKAAEKSGTVEGLAEPMQVAEAADVEAEKATATKKKRATAAKKKSEAETAAAKTGKTATSRAVNAENERTEDETGSDSARVEEKDASTAGSAEGSAASAGIISARGTETVHDTEQDGMLLVKLSRIQPDPDQPRKNFDEEKLNELAESIRTYGMISPIVVKKRGALYEIVAGERRWRAARIAGLKEIPVVIKEVDEKTSRELSIIENIQRDDLNAVEEARAYQSMIEEYGLTQEEVAARVAKNRSTITNSLRLLKLEPEILTLLQDGKITQGHARALLAVEDPELRKKIAEKCTKENLSVREIETLVKLDKLSKAKKEKKSSPEAQELRRLKVIYKDLERKMKTKLGTKVSIVPKNTERGTLEIEYYSQDDLDRIFMILNSSRND